jgi:protein SCO1
VDLPDCTVKESAPLTRRRFLWLGAALATQGLAPPALRAHNDAGRVVPPVPLPNLLLTLDDGKATRLGALLRGSTTALQLVFTRCRATCPIQGAVFAATARALAGAPPSLRLLSLTIDPEADGPEQLSAWLERHGRDPRWRAARPTPEGAAELLELLKARAGGPDRHTGQVYYADRSAALRLRSVDFPPAEEITRALRDLAGLKGAG